MSKLTKDMFVIEEDSLGGKLIWWIRDINADSAYLPVHTSRDNAEALMASIVEKGEITEEDVMLYPTGMTF